MTERMGAIVLAGGRSSRFGRDKLAEPIDGRRLLDLAIGAVQSVATDVVVVAAPGADLPLPDGVRLTHDAAAFEGPLVGLAAGLAALDPRVERVVVVAGDMPTLVPAVLRRLLDVVGSGIGAAILGRAGDTPPLPMALDRRRAATSTGELLDRGERRLRALATALDASVIPESAWRLDDPGATPLHDIDTPADLPVDAPRITLVQQLADDIVAFEPARRVIVAIDGVDGAGKTTLGDGLATLVTAHRPVVRASVDDFHRPAVERYARGRHSPEGFFLDSYDYETLIRVLLDPFVSGREVVTGVHDVVADSPRLVPSGIPAPNAVLVLDGMFLHRAELVGRWDLSIFLDVDFPVSIPRGAARGSGDPDPTARSNRRYVEGQRIYLTAADPRSRATIVIDNTDLDRPRIIKYGALIDHARRSKVTR